MWEQTEKDGQKQCITKHEKIKEISETFCDFRYFSVSHGMYWQKPLVLNHG
jgi:hypothetical protein